MAAAKCLAASLFCFSCILICLSQSTLSSAVDQSRTNQGPMMSSGSTTGSVIGTTIDDLSTGAANTTTNTKKNVHGVLSVAGWGILMSIGVYLKLNGCQKIGSIFTVSGYIIGLAGCGTGLKLGYDSPGITHHEAHKILGILIFCFVHSERFWFCGISISGPVVTVVMSIVNIYLGFGILQPDRHEWRNIYTGVLVFFGCIAAVWEITKCIICCWLGPGDFSYKPTETSDIVDTENNESSNV